MSIYNFNEFNELDEFGIDEIVEEYDAETVLNAKDGNWGYQEIDNEQPEIIYGNQADNYQDVFFKQDCSKEQKHNIKYSTQAEKVYLKEIASRLDSIDNIKDIKNPINAKISFDNNLISVSKQGVDGTVQIEVSGHEYGKNNGSSKANVFIQMN